VFHKRTDESRNAASRGSVGRPWPAIPFLTKVGFWAWSWPLPWAKSRDCLLLTFVVFGDGEKERERDASMMMTMRKLYHKKRGDDTTVDEERPWIGVVVIFSSGHRIV
jgi:hypothetical protein